MMQREARIGKYAYIQGQWLRIYSREDGYILNASDLLCNKPALGGSEHSNERHYCRIVNPTEASAYKSSVFCRYKGLEYPVYSVSKRGGVHIYMDMLDRELLDLLGDKVSYGYDGAVAYLRGKRIKDMWEVREPIEGFRFDVPPIVHLKRNGVWLELQPEEIGVSPRAQLKRDEVWLESELGGEPPRLHRVNVFLFFIVASVLCLLIVLLLALL